MKRRTKATTTNGTEAKRRIACYQQKARRGWANAQRRPTLKIPSNDATPSVLPPPML
ncbi:hypothetical protein ACSS6W_004950 [Trichoderma asperelloides]